MKQPRINRRQFFKLTAFSVVAAAGLPAIGLASLVAAPSKEAIAAAEAPHGPAIPQPTFNPIASNTTFGPLTDISMGWDGTLWGIDGQGAPHIYDEINKVWAQHGDSVDAAALSGDGSTIYVFQGPNVIPVNGATMTAGAPTTIAALWPTLPDSFKLGVNGAMTSRYGTGLLLFNGGRYVSTDGTVPLGKLADLPGWPTTGVWTTSVTVNGVTKTDGVIDAAYSVLEAGVQVLQRAGQAMRVVISQTDIEVWTDPEPFASFVNRWFVDPATASWVSSGGGVDAMIAGPGSPTPLVFKGTSVLVYAYQAGPPKYIGATFNNWPIHPVLAHAPNGRDGNLWSVLPSAQGSWIVQHNGNSWTRVNNQADHVGVGQDNTVMIASAQKLWKFTGALDGSGFTPVSPVNNLIQVSLGNANAVHARDSAGNVYRFDPSSGTLTQNTAVGTVAHIATTSDGTLWHAKPSDPNMHRQILGAGVAPQAIPIKNGLTATVSKVAGTGFGAAHCLTQDSQGNTQAYRYDSPYVFKTATSYNVGTGSGAPQQIEQGAGLLFLVNGNQVMDNPFIFTTQLIAIDSHTGVEVARTPVLPQPMNYTQPVFDPLHNLLYVTTYNATDGTDNTTSGQLLALDPRTLAVKWSFTAPASMDAAALLTGTQLFVSDRTGKLYMFDTSAAATNPANVQPRWAVNVAASVPPTSASTYRITQPAYVPVSAPGYPSDLIYVAVWLYDYSGGRGAETTSGYWMSVWVGAGAINDAPQGLFKSADPNFGFATLVTAPARGTLNIGSDSAPNYSPALYYNCYKQVIAVGGGPTLKTFQLPAGDWISTGFTYDDGRGPEDSLTSAPLPADAGSLWFGTNTGQLYCLNTSLSPVNYTPASIAPANQSFFYTTPTLYKDTQGNVTVFFQARGGDTNSIPSLYGFDPDNGNFAALPTGATTIAALAKTITHGVLYAAGFIENGSTTATQFPQVFGIRVDQLVQAERDFIIESQLMQDPQDPGGTGGTKVTTSDGNVIPNSVSRYQTHLTVVDDKKHPLPNESVKIWADVAGTVITVNNTQYTIGPDDAAYASVKTGADGCVVIVSEATDVNTSALRVWAPFMDPFERIMVYPDHEWHGRVAQSNVNDAQPDPGNPNLNKAYKYDGTTLFTDSERQQGTPTNVANAVGQMNSGLNPGGNSPAAFAGALKTLHGSNPIAPYVAYTTLGGMHYGPNNARAKRTVTVSAPFGFQLNKPAGGTHTYTPLTHSDARSAIDALDGKPWDPNNPNGTAMTSEVKPMTFVIRRSDDLFTDFWNWLKGVVSQIENVIVSVADDIMVGINFIANGIKQAFKAIIKVIEDVVNAIGSFFLQLLKAIEDLIAALSILFHFGEIMWTHRWLVSMLAYQKEQLKTVLIANAKTAIDGFLTQGEEVISGFIDSVKADLNPQQSFNTMPGAGATPHSVMTAGPNQAGNTNSGSSQAVQGGWGIQKMKSGFNVPGASSSLSSAAASAAVAATASAEPKASSDDPVTAFITGFLDSLKTNTQLSNALNDTQNDINTLFTAKSPGAFFTGLLTTLLDILKTMLDAALAISKAVVDGVFNALSDIIDAIWAAIDDPIDFPVISWLYQLLFGEPLTLLNLATLVVAIPVTVIYRVVANEYPQDSFNANPYQPWAASTSVAQISSPQRALIVAPNWAQKFIGTASGIFNLIYGILTAINDFIFAIDPEGQLNTLVGWLGNLAYGLGMVNALLGYPGFSTALGDITVDTWISWGLSCIATCFGVTGLSKFSWNEGETIILGVVNSILYVVVLIAGVVAFDKNGKRDVNTDLGFASTVFGCVPSIVNPIKFVDRELSVLDSGLDLMSGLWTCALTIAGTWHSEPSAIRRQRRLFFPFIAVDSGNPRAIPLAGGTTP